MTRLLYTRVLAFITKWPIKKKITNPYVTNDGLKNDNNSEMVDLTAQIHFKEATKKVNPF